MLNRREIFDKTMNHEDCGYVLVDMGKHIGSIHELAYNKLKSYLPDIHFADHNQILDRMAQTVVLEEGLLQKFDIDFRWLHPNINSAMVDVDENVYKDMWGVGFIFAGDYWCPRMAPLAECNTLEELEKFSWPDPDNPELFKGLREQAQWLHENTDYIIGADGLKNGLLMTALQMRGYEQFMMDIVLNTSYAEALLDKILELIKKMWTNYLNAAGEYVQLVYLTDDYGTQASMLISPDMFRNVIKPRNKELIDHIKGLANVKVMFHSDGSILPILDDLIETGVDILNPVQTSTKGMDDTEALKENYGDRLCFHGAIDVQQVLPSGTPETIKEEVRRRMAELGTNGGYICAPCHNIGHDIAPENIIALYEATKEFKKSVK